ncbi:MAG: gamma-glutamyltransferase [Longimicrobiales bacterium]
MAMLLQQQPASATGGMVSSAHPRATEAGLEILRAGGNAFDAAVAVAAVLNVVEPAMSGMGGYGTILVYDVNRKQARFLNSSGRIPRLTDSDAMRPPAPNYLENRRGAKAVSTPGNANAWEAMSRTYGKLPWTRLFEPAIRLAADGFALDSGTASHIRNAWNEFPEHARAFYGRAGQPLTAGELLVQRDLAQSLRALAAGGAKVLHGGAIGAQIDGAMQAAGGFLRLSDLANNQAEWWDPIAIDFAGHRIVTTSPPANSFDALVRVGMMGEYDMKRLGHNSAAYLHRFAEVSKHGFWVRLRWAGDPDLTPPPVQRLLARDYFREQIARIDTLRASTFAPPFAAAAARDYEEDTGHTTHFVVADQWGNVVSMTQTLGNVFGSRIMVPGTGIWLNNSLAYSTFEPKGNPMDAVGGRRKLSGDVPMLVLRDGRPWLAIGTPGGHSIGQTVPQIVLNAVVFGMDIQQAIAAPRISFAEPNVLQVERTIADAVRAQLAAMGHDLRVTNALGNAHGLTITYDAAGQPIRFQGGADPRGVGNAAGPSRR